MGLNEALADRLEILQVDPHRPFILRADASDKAIRAVLEQHREITPGKEDVVPVCVFFFPAVKWVSRN